VYPKFQAEAAMPRFHRDALACLIGFLKVVLAPETNLTTIAQLFGSNCVRTKRMEVKELVQVPDRQLGCVGREMNELCECV
jgi:hypothetical protein